MPDSINEDSLGPRCQDEPDLNHGGVTVGTPSSTEQLNEGLEPSTEFIDFVIYYFYGGQVWTVSKLDSGEITDGKVFGGRTFIEPGDLGEDAQFDGGGVGSDIYLTFQIHDEAHDMEEVEISMDRDMDELVDHFYERLEPYL